MAETQSKTALLAKWSTAADLRSAPSGSWVRIPHSATSWSYDIKLIPAK